MIKFVVAAVWIVAVTVGSIMFAFSSGEDKAAEPAEPAAFFGGLDYVKTDVLSIPVIRGNAVQGYFLSRLVYTVDPKRAAAMSVPLDALLIDEVYTYLFSNPLIDFTQTDKLDIAAFKTGLKESINKRVGEELVHEVLLEQVDYLSKADIRDNTAKRRAGVRETKPEPAKAPAGH